MSRVMSVAECNNLVRTFHQFDQDNSNTIDVEELAKVMEHLGVSMDATQLSELVEQVDANKNHELEFDEFTQLLTMWKDASRFKLFDSHGIKSMSKQRVENALKTKLLLTDSWPRFVFDALIAIGACVYWIVVLLDDAWGSQSSFLPIEIIVTVLFFLDIVVCSFTVSIDGMFLLDDVTDTMRAYSRGWLIPDVFAALPWDLMLSGVSGRIVRHLRLLKVFKIPYLWQTSGRMPINATYISVHFKFLPISLLLLVFLLVVHALTIGYMLVKQQVGTDSMLTRDGVYPYETAVYFVVYTLCTVGFGDVDIDTPSEKWYACLVLCGALMTNGFIIGKLVAIMQKADIQQDRTGKLRETLALLQHCRMPLSLQDEVLQFQDHLLRHSLSASYTSIVEGLPQEMQNNISLFVKLRLIKNAPEFDSVHYIVRVAIAEALANSVVLPEQYVIVANEPITTMYFIGHGFVDQFGVASLHLRTLTSGDYFGESALCELCRSVYSYKALAYCDMWGLHRADLLPLLERFPRFQRIIHDKHDEICKGAPKYEEASPTAGAAQTASGGGGGVHEGFASGSSLQQQQQRAARPRRGSFRQGSALGLAALSNDEKLENILERLDVCMNKMRDVLL